MYYILIKRQIIKLSTDRSYFIACTKVWMQGTGFQIFYICLGFCFMKFGGKKGVTKSSKSFPFFFLQIK